MSIGDIVALLRGGIFQVLIMAAPLLLSALIVGLVIAILQAATSKQEQTLTFVPKVVVILLILAVFGELKLIPIWVFITNLWRDGL